MSGRHVATRNSSSSTFAVNFPGVRSPLSLTVTDSPDGAAFLGSVWTLRTDAGGWICEHAGPPLSRAARHDGRMGAGAGVGAVPWAGLMTDAVPSLFRQLYDAFLPALGVVFAFPLPPGARVRGFFLTADDARAERDRLLKRRPAAFQPRRRTLARPPPAGPPATRTVHQLLVDGAVVDSCADARRAVRGAKPHSVSLSSAVAASPSAASHHAPDGAAVTIKWMPDVTAVRDATQLLRSRCIAPPASAEGSGGSDRATSQPSASAELASSLSALTSGSDALLDALPVFSVPSMVIGLPGVDGERTLFRPWFLSKRCLDAVLGWAHEQHMRHVLRLRSAQRRDLAVATARGAAFMRAFAFGDELPPLDGTGGVMSPPSSPGQNDDDDDASAGDSLEDGGVDDTDSLVKEYMQDLLGNRGGQSITGTGVFGDDDSGDASSNGRHAPPGIPAGGLLSKVLFPWLALPPSPSGAQQQQQPDDGEDAGKHNGLRIEPPTAVHAAAAAALGTALAFAAVTMALTAPVGDALDGLLARCAPGRRLLLTGRLTPGPGSPNALDSLISVEDLTVSTWQRVRDDAALALATARKERRVRRSRWRGGNNDDGGDGSKAVQGVPGVMSGLLQPDEDGHSIAPDRLGDDGPRPDEDGGDSDGDDGDAPRGEGDAAAPGRVPSLEEFEKVVRPLFVGDLGILETARKRRRRQRRM